jgi:DNA transformation protein
MFDPLKKEPASFIASIVRRDLPLVKEIAPSGVRRLDRISYGTRIHLNRKCMTESVKKTKELTDLPNIGPVLAATLRRVGIETPADLTAVGSIDVLLRIHRTIPDDKACVHKLYALEGAIRGVRSNDVPKGERAELWRRFQALCRKDDRP